jgi:hypothetical protein
MCIVSAEMFGAWGIWRHSNNGALQELFLGVFGLVGGFVLSAYAIWFVHKLDRSGIA